MNDADLEMMELDEAANMTAAGVCNVCEDVLDPFNPKWKEADFPTTMRDGVKRPVTRAEYAELVGPVDAQLHIHERCKRDIWDD